jgi:hypothetical protein
MTILSWMTPPSPVSLSSGTGKYDATGLSSYMNITVNIPGIRERWLSESKIFF